MTEAIPQRMLSRMAYEKIRGYIADNRLQAGDRLPTERELARLLEVSRPVVREALGTMEAIGLIEKKQGSGIFIKDPDFSTLFQEMLDVWGRDDEDGRGMLQFRVLLEQAAVTPILERALERDFDRLEELIAEAEADHIADADFIRLDYRFHKELLELTGNAFFVQLTGTVNAYFQWVETNRAKEAGLPGKALTLKEHRDIVRALRHRDGDEARRLIRRHLTGEA